MSERRKSEASSSSQSAVPLNKIKNRRASNASNSRPVGLPVGINRGAVDSTNLLLSRYHETPQRSSENNKENRTESLTTKMTTQAEDSINGNNQEEGSSRLVGHPIENTSSKSKLTLKTATIRELEAVMGMTNLMFPFLRKETKNSNAIVDSQKPTKLPIGIKRKRDNSDGPEENIIGRKKIKRNNSRKENKVHPRSTEYNKDNEGNKENRPPLDASFSPPPNLSPPYTPATELLARNKRMDHKNLKKSHEALSNLNVKVEDSDTRNTSTSSEGSVCSQEIDNDEANTNVRSDSVRIEKEKKINKPQSLFDGFEISQVKDMGKKYRSIVRKHLQSETIGRLAVHEKCLRTSMEISHQRKDQLDTAKMIIEEFLAYFLNLVGVDNKGEVDTSMQCTIPKFIEMTNGFGPSCMITCIDQLLEYIKVQTEILELMPSLRHPLEKKEDVKQNVEAQGVKPREDQAIKAQDTDGSANLLASDNVKKENGEVEDVSQQGIKQEQQMSSTQLAQIELSLMQPLSPLSPVPPPQPAVYNHAALAFNFPAFMRQASAPSLPTFSQKPPRKPVSSYPALEEILNRKPCLPTQQTTVAPQQSQVLPQKAWAHPKQDQPPPHPVALTVAPQQAQALPQKAWAHPKQDQPPPHPVASTVAPQQAQALSQKAWVHPKQDQPPPHPVAPTVAPQQAQALPQKAWVHPKQDQPPPHPVAPTVAPQQAQALPQKAWVHPKQDQPPPHPVAPTVAPQQAQALPQKAWVHPKQDQPPLHPMTPFMYPYPHYPMMMMTPYPGLALPSAEFYQQVDAQMNFAQQNDMPPTRPHSSPPQQERFCALDVRDTTNTCYLSSSNSATNPPSPPQNQRISLETAKKSYHEANPGPEAPTTTNNPNESAIASWNGRDQSASVYLPGCYPSMSRLQTWMLYVNSKHMMQHVAPTHAPPHAPTHAPTHASSHAPTLAPTHAPPPQPQFLKNITYAPARRSYPTFDNQPKNIPTTAPSDP